MRALRSILRCGIVLMSVAGCATHPLPEDVSGKTTLAIVEKLRCEARDAVIDALVAELRYRSTKTNALGGERLTALADDIAKRPLGIVDFVDRFDKDDKALIEDLKSGVRDPKDDTQARITRYRGSTIAMEFTFDMTENDNNTLTLGLSDPSPLKTFNLSITTGHEKSRENKRNFKVSYNFNDLIKGRDLAIECSTLDIRSVNFVYPITGSVGLKEVVSTFLKIAEYVGFEESSDFSDTLTFKTKIYGNGDPKMTFTPGNDDFHLDSAANTNKAERIDSHQVVIAVALPKIAKVRGGGEKPPAAATLAGSRKAMEAASSDTKAEANNILDRVRRQDFLQTQDDILQRLDELE